MDRLDSKNANAGVFLEILLLGTAEKEVGSMWGFVISTAHPQNIFLIAYCMKAPGNSAWWSHACVL